MTIDPTALAFLPVLVVGFMLGMVLFGLSKLLRYYTDERRRERRLTRVLAQIREEHVRQLQVVRSSPRARRPADPLEPTQIPKLPEEVSRLTLRIERLADYFGELEAGWSLEASRDFGVELERTRRQAQALLSLVAPGLKKETMMSARTNGRPAVVVHPHQERV